MSDHRFICNHCGKSFQLETPDAKECPSCFWTSSIKREDEAQAEKKKSPSSGSRAASRSNTKQLSSGLLFLAKGLFILVLLGGVIFLGYRLFTKKDAVPKQSDGPISISSKDVKEMQASQKTAAAILAGLSPEAKETLYREVTLPGTVEPGARGKEILDHAVELKTGRSEKLPSTIWTLEQYQQMIAEQESFYKMPFARSYRKKLNELFTTHYIPGGEAFARGDLLDARNLWIASLAFPLYSKDLQKHRAVALTMFKPFINDTLAKIGNLNQALAVREIHNREEAINKAYQNLSGLIAQKKWAEAIQTIDQLKPAMDQLNAASKKPALPPPYPPAIAMVDRDIQRPLADLLATNPVSVANLLSLKQDLAEKKDVLAGLTGKQLEASEQAYRDALVMIREERWQAALNALSTIHSPEVLRNAAQAKIAILQKILGQGLDSSEGAG